MQKQQRSVQKGVMHLRSCCFANVSCKRRERQVINVIWHFDVGIMWTCLLDGKANCCWQWFLSLCSVASCQEQPLFAGYKGDDKSSKIKTLNYEKVDGSWTVSLCLCLSKKEGKGPSFIVIQVQLNQSTNGPPLHNGNFFGQTVIHSLLFQPLHNGHFLLSARWPLQRGSTVCFSLLGNSFDRG